MADHSPIMNRGHNPRVTMHTFPHCTFCLDLFQTYCTSDTTNEEAFKKLKEKLDFHGIDEHPSSWLNRMGRATQDLFNTYNKI